MAYDLQNFFNEFEALKAKYGDEFKDLKVVRFHAKKGYELAGPELRQFTPYWCRMDDEGFINCESEREQ
jgi:hypothetical protein